MNRLCRVLVMCFIATVSMWFFTENSVDAKSAEKIYKKYHLPSESTKFPIKLSNSLVIDTVGDGSEIIIKKDNRTVWQGQGIGSWSEIAFTVTKTNDTFLSFLHGAGGSDLVDIIGISSKGNVFMQKPFHGDGASMYVDFITPSSIEVQVERYNPIGDGPIADKHSGEFSSKFYQLYINGSVKELNFFDNAFVSLAKKGQVKGIPGTLGMTFSKIKAVVKDPFATQDIAEVYNFYHAKDASYGFIHNNNYSNAIKSQAKVRGIFRNSDVYGNRKTLRPFFQKSFGKEFASVGTRLDIYKAGKYYLAVQYDNGKVSVDLNTQMIYTISP